jgi:hypothetical protein
LGIEDHIRRSGHEVLCRTACFKALKCFGVS